ncbi:MAG: serine/threonine protein kinase, bacterial [Chthoniobacter sp.]|jgi:serine/threonine-protein kinase|nr:serine/threonine protein kinase, bacterial [Chthoniobacter sp.]
MDPLAALNCRAQVEDFQRRHRSKLVTMLFSDIVGSTKLKQILGDRGAIEAIQAHHALFREILGSFEEGEEISTAGDSFFLVFTKPSDAVRFSLLVQAGMRRLAGQTGHPVLDRIGIHVGEVWVNESAGPGKNKDLYGMQVDTCARVSSLGGADQILLSRFAFDSARQVLRGDDLGNLAPLSWLNHGPYLIKGVEEPLEVCEVGETGKSALTRPADTDKARRFLSPDSEPVLGWRPAVDQRVPGTSWVLEKKLGEGGFGEVWLGRDKVFKTQHVFKFCFRADRVRSLKREATLFRLLKERIGAHPNIVAVEKVYFDEPPFYIVMDYVEGENLSAWCEAQGGVSKVPLAVRLEIVAQVAAALQAAHDSGVIHRDVKPSNILVSGAAAGKVHVHLTDFGIGQVVSAEALAGITRLGFTQTMLESSPQGGTHLYMAPELMAGFPASIRSDIYALGVVLYQLLIGDLSRPVTTDWTRQVAEPLLVEDLARCFAGDPQERFAGAEQLAGQLRSLESRRVLVTEQQALLNARVQAAYRRGIMRTVVVASAVVAAVAALAFYAFQKARQASLAGIEAQQSLAQALRETRRATQAQANAEEARLLAAAKALEAQNSAEAAVKPERSPRPPGSSPPPGPPKRCAPRKRRKRPPSGRFNPRTRPKQQPGRPKMRPRKRCSRKRRPKTPPNKRCNPRSKPKRRRSEPGNPRPMPRRPHSGPKTSSKPRARSIHAGRSSSSRMAIGSKRSPTSIERSAIGPGTPRRPCGSGASCGTGPGLEVSFPLRSLTGRAPKIAF